MSEQQKKKVAWLLHLIHFLWAIAFALPLYIQSSFIESIVGIKFVGLVLAVSTSATLLALLILPNFLKKYHNFRVTLFISLAVFIVTILIYVVPGVWSLVFYVFYIALMTLLVVCFDIFLESISTNDKTGQIRTLKLFFINLAILISPLISGNLVGSFDNYRLVFLWAGLVFLATPFLLLLRKKELDDRTVEYQKRSLYSLEKIFQTHPNILRSIFIEYGLRIFYATMVLYLPIYLHERIGFDWPTIGIIFTIMLLPFVLLQVPAGRLADKYLGEKEMIIGGIFFMITFSVIVIWLNTDSVFWWALILFMTRVGASLVEAMNEVFFFKQVDNHDADLIDIFRDVRPIGWLTVSLISFVLLLVFPGNILNIIWFMVVVLILVLYPAAKLVDTK